MNLESFLFADRLRTHLRDGSLRFALEHFGSLRFEPEHFVVEGGLPTPLTIARVRIWVWGDALLPCRPPRVWCMEPWIRYAAEWHSGKANGLCWVLAEQWRDEMAHGGITPRILVDVGTNWLIEGASSLIDRHFVGHQRKLTRWPRKWRAYEHFEFGAHQYEREKAAAALSATPRRAQARANTLTRTTSASRGR